MSTVVMKSGDLQVVLERGGDGFALPEGDTLVGRDPGCRVWLRDASVSRRHVRVRVAGDSVSIDDLGSANGSFINGQRFVGRREVRTGDVLRLGNVELRVRVVRPIEVACFFTQDTDVQAHDDFDDFDDIDGDGVVHTVRAEGTSRYCPSCHSRMSFIARVCEDCGEVVGAEVGADPVSSRVLVRYQSEYMAFDAVGQEWSASHVFIGTHLLESVGTACQVTIETLGRPAITYRGVVQKVVATGAHHSGRPPGLLVEFMI